MQVNNAYCWLINERYSGDWLRIVKFYHRYFSKHDFSFSHTITVYVILPQKYFLFALAVAYAFICTTLNHNKAKVMK